MRGYYCVSPGDREFVFVPFVLFSYCPNSRKPVHNWDENTLENLTLAIKEGKITAERLEDRGWEVHEIEIPKKMIKKFRDFCFKRESEKSINKKADRIFDFAYNYAKHQDEFSPHLANDDNIYRDSYYEDYDIEE